MGWLFYQHYGAETVDLLKKEFCPPKRPGASYEWTWIDHSQRGTTVYAVIARKPLGAWEPDDTYVNEADGTIRILCVFLTSRRNGEFGYKDMTESMGPCERDCPKRIIDAASPLRDGTKSYAVQWRADCLRKKEVRPSIAKMKVGQRLRFEKPITFGNFAASEFTVTTYWSKGKERKCLATPEGRLCRISRLDRHEFQIV